jgi:hypothetical protein
MGGPGPFGPAPALKSGLVTFLIALPLVFAASFAWELLPARLGLPDEKQDMVDILQNTQLPGP